MPEDDYGMGAGDVEFPKNPGPNALGHEPLIGSVRRSNDLPVIRDKVADAVDGTDAVDLPDKPVIPALSLDR
jgi:hypothetical protein